MEYVFNNIVSIVFSLVGYVSNILLTPINFLIDSALDFTSVGVSLSDIADTCELFFNNLVSYANWFLSFTGIPQIVIDILIIEFVGMLTVPLAVHSIKLAISWYNQIKLG